MKKLLVLTALVALVAVPALADRGAVRSDTPRIGYSQPRDAVELGYDDDSFEGYGTSPDWSDETVMVAEVPAGGPYTLETVRFFGFGMTDRPVIFRAASDLVSPPGDILNQDIMFNFGVDAWEDALWVDVDVSSLGLVYNSGDFICAGMPLDGTDGIGLDDSCYQLGSCGVYWAMWGGAWGQDADYGYNDGIRFVITGGTAVSHISLSAVRKMY